MQLFDVYMVKDENGGFIEKVDPACLAEDEGINVNVLLVKRDEDSNRLLHQSSVRQR